MLAVELHREPGRQLPRHDDDLLVAGNRPRLGTGAAQEVVEHPELNGVEVGQPLAQPGRARPQVAQLERLELVGRLGAQLVVADQRLDRGEEVLVLRHQDLGVEDASTPRDRRAGAPAARDR